MLQSHMQIPLSSNQLFWTRSFSTEFDTSRDIFCPVCHFFFSIFNELWTMINFPLCLKLSKTFYSSTMFVTSLFLPFSTLDVPTKMFFYRLTSSSMCHHSSMYSLYLTVAVSAMIEWRFWFPKKRKKKLLGTNSLMSSYTQMVVEIWSRFDRG